MVADPPSLSVSGVRDVSEGSYAVFTVSLDKLQTVATGIVLQLGDGAAVIANDLNSTTMEVVTDLGTAIGSGTPVVNGGTYTLAVTSQVFYVRVLTKQDTSYEGAEDFSLTASFSSAISRI